MIPLDIRFDEGWPELGAADEGTLAGISVLSMGTTEGRPSVYIRIDLEEQVVLAQTSARLFCTAAKMIMAKYPGLFEGP